MLTISREVSGVTAACAGIRRETFLDIGGFSEMLPTNFNDVDLSYKVRHAGLRVVVLPSVELYHFESQTRERRVEDWERDRVEARWGPPDVDPYYPT